MTRSDEAHVDPVTLVDYLRGQLPAPMAAAVRAHCHTCGDCGDQLAAVMLLRRGAEARASHRRRRVLVAAATVVLVVAAGAFLLLRGGLVEGIGAAVPLAEQQPEPESPPLQTASFEDLPVPLQDEEFRSVVGISLGFIAKKHSGTAVRAADVDPSASLGMSAERLLTIDFEGSADALRIFADRWDPFGTPLLGVSLYLSGETVAAEPILADAYRKLSSTSPTSRDGSMMNATRLLLAWSLVQRDRRAEARELLEPIRDNLLSDETGDVFQQQARSLLRRLETSER